MSYSLPMGSNFEISQHRRSRFPWSDQDQIWPSNATTHPGPKSTPRACACTKNSVLVPFDIRNSHFVIRVLLSERSHAQVLVGGAHQNMPAACVPRRSE